MFLSDSDSEEEGVVIKSTWKLRHHKKEAPLGTDTLRGHSESESTREQGPKNQEQGALQRSGSLKSSTSLSKLEFPLREAKSVHPVFSPRTPQVVFDSSESSNDEFESLMERIKQKNRGLGSHSSLAGSAPSTGTAAFTNHFHIELLWFQKTSDAVLVFGYTNRWSIRLHFWVMGLFQLFP